MRETMTPEKCITAFKNKRVAVIGDLMLDVYVKGNATRISPEAPVPVLQVKEVSSCLGGAANVMRNLVTLGARVTAFGAVGDDLSGRRIKDELKAFKINSKYVLQDPTRPTIEKQRIIAGQQQIVRIDFENVTPISESLRMKILESLIQQILKGEFDAVIIEDYAKGLLCQTMFEKIIAATKKMNIVVSLDPHPKQTFKAKGLTVMTPNRNEAFGLAGVPVEDPVIPPEKDKQLMKVGEKLKKEWACQNLLITLGAQGMALYADKSPCKVIATRAREVYDVSGAGDTVIAAFTLALLGGATPEFATFFANHAAGVVVGKHGTVAVQPDEIIKSFNESK